MSNILRTSLWVISSFILVTLATASSSTSANDKGNYWVCYQVGTIKKEDVSVAISKIFYVSQTKDHDKEKKFEDVVVSNIKEFYPEFNAQCEEYNSEKKAKVRLKQKLNKYKERKYTVFIIPFKI